MSVRVVQVAELGGRLLGTAAASVLYLLLAGRNLHPRTHSQLQPGHLSGTRIAAILVRTVLQYITARTKPYTYYGSGAKDPKIF